MLFHGSDSSWLAAKPGNDTSFSSGIAWQRAAARRGLIVYFVLLILFSAFTNWLFVATDTIFGVFFLMWSPGVAALLTRLILSEGWQDVSFRLGGRKNWLAIGVAVIAPVVVGLIAYGFAWTTGLAHMVGFHLSDDLDFGLTFLGNWPSWLMLPLLILSFLVAEIVSAAGEEIGWRGYMLTRLIDAGVPQPILVSGLIWSFWHWPSMLLVSDDLNVPLLLSACVFVVTITCLGFLAARLRLQTGSIWPSIALHAAWNCCILELFDAVTSNSDTSFWTGESGVLVALVMIMMAYIFWHGTWKMRRSVD
jgi:uncharacterized protein